MIIAGAGGAAHLPGHAGGFIRICQFLGVPVESAALKGMDSLLSIVQMPAGVPVGTLAIGHAGAKNAALAGGANSGPVRPGILAKAMKDMARKAQTANVAETPQ